MNKKIDRENLLNKIPVLHIVAKGEIHDFPASVHRERPGDMFRIELEGETFFLEIDNANSFIHFLMDKKENGQKTLIDATVHLKFVRADLL